MQTAEQRKHMCNVCNKLYHSIVAFIKQFGYPPNYREMCTLTGIKSTSQVRGYLNILVDWKWVEIEDGKCRTLRLTRPTEMEVHPQIRKNASAVSDCLGEKWAGES